MSSSKSPIFRRFRRLLATPFENHAGDRRPEMRATLYSRDGCMLCVEAERVVRRVFGSRKVDVVDIIGDRELEDAYIFRIPVLVVDGKVVAEGRITMADARSALAVARANRESDARP